MNVTSVEEVTEDDIAQAIAVPSVSYIINAVRAANRWKRFAARRTQSDSAHSDGSVASNEMSRAGSVDAIEALQQRHCRKGSNGSRDGAAPGSTTLSQRVSPEDTSSGKDAGRRPSAGSCSDQSTCDGYMAARTDRFLPSGSHTAAKPGASSNKEENPTTSTLKPSDSTASLTATDATTTATSTTTSSSASGIKAAMSFPQSERGPKEKRPAMTTAETASPTSPKMGIKSFDSMVDFPEIDRSLSQQEYLSNNGIDDSSVEVVSRMDRECPCLRFAVS